MESVSMLIDSTASKIQQLQKAFAELESHRSITLNIKWKELEEHFNGLERSLKRRFIELEDQEKQFENKTMEAQVMLGEREEAIVAKEHALLGTLQEKRDSAVSAITCAKEKQQEISSDLDEKPLDHISYDSILVQPNSSEDGNLNMCEDGIVKVKVKAYPQLVKICEDLDSEALHKFISDNRKNLDALREEIPHALRVAADPAGLVLASLEKFYGNENPKLDAKKDSSLIGVRRTCILLMECLSILLLNSELGCACISKAAKDHAWIIAEEWKPKLDVLDMDASHGSSLEAHAFLQLLATFGISSDFKEEEITKLIPKVCRRRQAADLCHSLGLSEKMPGIIEVLINTGRQIEAVNLAFAFNLTERFSPVPLLKAYLKDVKKTTSPIKPGNTSPTSQSYEFDEQELIAHKAVIKCIEDHKLQQSYPLRPLQTRLIHLEKAKAANKRLTESAKPQPKRPRASASGPGSRIPNPASPISQYRGYVPYVYERPYLYAENRGSCFFASYGVEDSIHGSYSGNGYPYPAPYLR